MVGGGRLAAAAAFADPRLDATRAQRVFELPRVVAAVGPQLLGPVAGRAQRVDQGQQVGAFVFVAGAEPDLQRPAVRVDDQVVLARGKAAIDGARTDQVAPLFASTREASTTSRDQSSFCIWSSSATRSASA